MEAPVRKLTLVTNNEVEPRRCYARVNMDGAVLEYEEFVCIGYNPTFGDVELSNNADALTMALATYYVGKRANEMLYELPPDVREEVMKVYHEMIGGDV